MKTKNRYLIDKLIEDNWFEDEKEAASWLLARRILVDGHPAHSLKEKVKPDCIIRVKEYYKRRYVNKGGLKLEHALDCFGIDVAGKIALDCGASTGGFTDCLITRGAAKVYAVDIGHGQLAGKLLTDTRVVNMEKTNLSAPALTTLNPPPDIITLDLSYLSLTKALPLCGEIFAGREGDVVALIKPLFEIDCPDVKRTGVIEDKDTYRTVLQSLCGGFAGQGITVAGLTHSPVTGNSGTYEYFAHLKLNCDAADIDIAKEIETAVGNSFALEKFDKNKYS